MVLYMAGIELACVSVCECTAYGVRHPRMLRSTNQLQKGDEYPVGQRERNYDS